MEHQQLYESPWAEVIIVAQEGFVCASEVINGSNSIKAWENGDSTTEDVYM